MPLLKAMATVAGMTGLSRIAGFIRDILMAAILGAGPVADAFFVALKLPNFFRRVTAEGAFSVSFIPVYSKTLKNEGEEEAGRFAGNVFGIMFLSLSVFTVLGLWAMPYVIYVIAPGFADDPERHRMAVEMTRITLPYLLLISLSALIGGMLNAHNRFAAFAFAPVLFNLCLIIALLSGSDTLDTPGHALSWGIFTAGILQLILLVSVLRVHGVPLTLSVPRFDEKFHRILKLMGPGVIGAGVMQINLFADMIIASLLGPGSISYLYYADRLNQLPLGVVGIAVGTALLPMLSQAIAEKDISKAQDLFNRSLEYCLIFALPAAVALAVIPFTLVEGLFERGAFTAEATHQTGFVLIGYALGLPAYIFVKVLSTVYWAQEDTKTPVKIAIYTTLLNIVFSLILVWPLGVAGIAFSTGLTGWLQFWLLNRNLRQKHLDTAIAKLDGRFRSALPKIVAGTLIMGSALYILNILLTQNLEGLFPGESVAIMVLLVFSGMAIYALTLFKTGVLRTSDIKTYFKR